MTTSTQRLRRCLWMGFYHQFILFLVLLSSLCCGFMIQQFPTTTRMSTGTRIPITIHGHGHGHANSHENLLHLDSGSLATLSTTTTRTTTTRTALYAKVASTTVLHASFNSTGHDFAYQKPAYRSSIPPPPPPPPPSVEETAQSPFPTMPSQTYFDLATSQFELLINSIKFDNNSNSDDSSSPSSNGNGNGAKKIKSLALYLPQENPNTGQLEFMPSLVTPPLPTSERVFIASDVQPTGYHVPPTLPPTLTQLPGFAHAATLLPAYPFTTGAGVGAGSGNNNNGSSDGGKIGSVGVPEEVFCDLNLGKGISPSSSASASASTLSLPLFSGPHTIGILLIWGSEPEGMQHIPKTIAGSMWTADDKEQIKRVGESLALALCMDSDRFQSKIRSEEIRVALADNLHQVKNPVQALRTFSKLLQRNLATGSDGLNGGNMNVAIGHLADDLVVQSERVVDLLLPMDSIINAMEGDGSGSGDGNGNGGVTSYQNLLAPMEHHNEVDANMISKEEDDIVKSGETGILLPASYHRRRSRSRSHSQSISDEDREQPNAKRGGHKRMLKKKQKDASENLGLQMSFIPDVLQPVISASKVLAAERGVDIQFYGMDDELPGVMICPKLLQEAVSNVLDNAVKYVTLGNNGRHGVSNCKPTVRLRMSPNFESDENLPPGVTIVIDDNGPGILENEKDLVFQRGYRGELTNQLSIGSGIGLNISRAMIGRMGGLLELLDSKSENFGGAAMRFVLFRSPDVSSSRN